MNRRPAAGSLPEPNATTVENATNRRLEVQTQAPPSLLEEAQQLLANVSCFPVTAAFSANTSALFDFFRDRGWDEHTKIVEELSETTPSGLPDEELRNMQDLLPRKIEYLKCYYNLARTTRENVGNLLKDLDGLVDEARYFATVVSTQGQEIDSRKRKAIELSSTVEKQIAEASRAKRVKMGEAAGGTRNSTTIVNRKLATQRMREASKIRFRDVEILQKYFDGQDTETVEFCTWMADTWNKLRREEWLDFDTYSATIRKFGAYEILSEDEHRELWDLQFRARESMGCFRTTRDMPIFLAVDYDTGLAGSVNL